MPATPAVHHPAPTLDLPTVLGPRFRLAERAPGRMTMLVMYRGGHCGACRAYLETLDGSMDAYDELGVDVVAVSMDGLDMAARTRLDGCLDRLPIAYGMTAEMARSWGLYLGRVSDGEVSGLRSEPATFLIDADGILRFASIHSGPVGRADPTSLADEIALVTTLEGARGRIAA
jgi:peroxiredoxin